MATFNIHRPPSGPTRITFEGEVGYDDIAAAVEAMTPEGHYLDRQRLWDFRGCVVDLTSGDLARLGALGAARDRHPTRAAVLVGRDFVFGLARVHEVFRESGLVATEVFRDEAEALVWLAESDVA